MRADIGGDAVSGVMHGLNTSMAKLHDSQVWGDLLHGAKTFVWADKGHVSAAREAAFSGPGTVWGVMRKAPKGSPLDSLDVQINHIIAKVRAKVLSVSSNASSVT